jgi:hypothetical protein
MESNVDYRKNVNFDYVDAVIEGITSVLPNAQSEIPTFGHG